MTNLSLGVFSRIASNEITTAEKIFGSIVQVMIKLILWNNNVERYNIHIHILCIMIR